jgi:hypothetical protein
MTNPAIGVINAEQPGISPVRTPFLGGLTKTGRLVIEKERLVIKNEELVRWELDLSLVFR